MISLNIVYKNQVSRSRFPEICAGVAEAAQKGSVRHFLIGNNLAFAESLDGMLLSSNENEHPKSEGYSEKEKERAKINISALVELLSSDPPIKTWYLAGNGIDECSSESLANALCKASHATSVWLKMNPIKKCAAHFGRLVVNHANLVVKKFNFRFLKTAFNPSNHSYSFLVGIA